MEKKLGYYAPICLVLGVVFGWGLGSANGNGAVGAGIGALVGVFLGWFIAAAHENQKKEKQGDSS
jgi:hypothetical protein